MNQQLTEKTQSRYLLYTQATEDGVFMAISDTTRGEFMHETTVESKGHTEEWFKHAIWAAKRSLQTNLTELFHKKADKEEKIEYHRRVLQKVMGNND